MLKTRDARIRPMDGETSLSNVNHAHFPDRNWESLSCASDPKHPHQVYVRMLNHDSEFCVFGTMF